MRDNIESNHLIFISSDGKREGYEIFKERIKNNMWPIYNKTQIIYMFSDVDRFLKVFKILEFNIK